MAAQFKKKISADRMIYPSGVYPDLYDNNKTTTDIQIGTVNGVTANSFMIGDFTMPVKNAFGDSKLVGANLGLFINSITRNNSSGGIPGFKVFKVPVNIGNREGGKLPENSPASLISLSDFTQICSYHEDGGIVENFDGNASPVEESSEVVQDVIVKSHGPYLLRSDGYKYGYRFGKKAGRFTEVSSSKHFKRYGETLEDGTQVYKLEYVDGPIYNKEAKVWQSKRESKGYIRHKHERWKTRHIGGNAKYVAMNMKNDRRNIVKYETTETVQRSNTDELVQRANTSNTFFDEVSEAQTFRVQAENDVVPKKVAFGDITFSTTTSRTDGTSLHMNNVYPHRDTIVSDLHYPKGTNDNTENQQTTFVTKQLPLPLHLYSARTISADGSATSGGANGKTKPLVSTVSMCLNFESLAPMLRRLGLATHGSAVSGEIEALTDINNQTKRLNRSICVTFGEEKPFVGEKFYDYVKRHAPDATAASSTGASTGRGTNAKSFMGLAFVNEDGKFSVAKLSRDYLNSSNPTGAQYTDVDFLLDAARGEVVVATDATLISEGLESKWLNVDFQLHPDGSHAHVGIYDPDTGALHTANGGFGIHNIKNITATGGGLWAMNDTTNYPKFMTIWNNNYAGVYGTFDTTEKKYKTGLQVATTSSGQTDGDGNFTSDPSELIEVFGNRELSDNNDAAFQGGNSLDMSAFLNIGTGDRLKIGGDDVTVIKRETGLGSNSFPMIRVHATGTTNGITVVAGDKIWFKSDDYLADNHVSGPQTMTNSLFIDNITLNNFNMGHSNATPSIVNPTPSRLKIPATYKTSSPGYYYSRGSNQVPSVNNVRENLADFPSYFCFGFDNISDFEGSAKFMMLGGFKVSGANDEIYMSATETITDPDASDASVGQGTVDAELNCVRVGYTSFENYGRQGAPDSLQRADDGNEYPEGNISQIPNPAATFVHGGTGTETSKRGLIVGDFGFNSANFSIHSNDAFNVDGFTQKGFMQWNFTRGITQMGSGDSAVKLTNNPGAGSFTFNVNTLTAGTTTLAVNNFIKVNNEVVKISAISGQSLTVVRNQDGTTGGAGSHSSGDIISLVAQPEKRECIFASARVLDIIDANTVKVDSSELFRLDELQEYVLYIYNDSHSNPTSGYPKTMLVNELDGDNVIFRERHHINKGDEYKFLISPKKYWLMVEIHNHTDGPLDRFDVGTNSLNTVYHEKIIVTNPDQSDREVIINEPLHETEVKINLLDTDGKLIQIGDVIQINEEKMLVINMGRSNDEGTGNEKITVKRAMFGTTATTHAKKSTVFFAPRRYLPEKSYDSAIMLTGLPDGSHSSFGATFNETLYNDGEYINSWDLDPFIKEDDTAIDLKDYGFGDFDEEDKSGGHLGHLNLNIKNDITTYKELDISGVVKVDNVSDNDTFTIMITPDEPNDSYKINVDTEDGTNPVYITALYEDDLPKITNFRIEPNEKDPFFVDYKWNCEDEDVWYGFLHVSDENIKDQYHGALMHIPLNDDAIDGESVTDDGENPPFTVLDAEGIGISFADNGISTTASFVPKFTIEGLAGNAVKFDSNDVLFVGSPDDNDDCFSSLGKEMSVVLHCINTSPNFNSADQFILRKGQLLSNMSLDIFGRRVGITNTGQIVARVYSDGATTNSKYVELTSNTIIRKDVPLNIIVTFDANLYRGNVKLFINGRLEDQTGEVLVSHAVGNNTGWIHKTDIFSGNGRLYIGAKSESMVSSGWIGTIEEIVIYDKLIYPVEVKSGQFTFTKPLEELTAEVSSSAKNYNARLFVKDYHNIRGSSKEDVAMTASKSYRKAAFNLNGVAD